MLFFFSSLPTLWVALSTDCCMDLFTAFGSSRIIFLKNYNKLCSFLDSMSMWVSEHATGYKFSSTIGAHCD